MGEEAEIEQILKRKPEQNQITDATRKMHEFKRMLGELDGKDLRQEWQMVTPVVLRECK